jgi:hypothetical protein
MSLRQPPSGSFSEIDRGDAQRRARPPPGRRPRCAAARLSASWRSGVRSLRCDDIRLWISSAPYERRRPRPDQGDRPAGAHHLVHAFGLSHLRRHHALGRRACRLLGLWPQHRPAAGRRLHPHHVVLRRHPGPHRRPLRLLPPATDEALGRGRCRPERAGRPTPGAPRLSGPDHRLRAAREGRWRCRAARPHRRQPLGRLPPRLALRPLRARELLVAVHARAR